MGKNVTAYDLAEGIERVRWGDSENDVLAAYPWAEHVTKIHGKDAGGKVLVIPEALVVADFVSLPGVSIQALVGFSECRVVGVDLFPRGLYQQLVSLKPLRQAVVALGARMGVQVDDAATEWEVSGAWVDVWFKYNDFVMSIYAPNTDLARRTPHHRAYRLLQAQRAARFPNQ